MKRKKRVVFYVTDEEQAMLQALVAEGGESQATTLRQLIRAETRRRARSKREESAPGDEFGESSPD